MGQPQQFVDKRTNVAAILQETFYSVFLTTYIQFIVITHYIQYWFYVFMTAVQMELTMETLVNVLVAKV